MNRNIYPLTIILILLTSNDLLHGDYITIEEHESFQFQRFRGEPGTIPFGSGRRLPFTAPLDKDLPPLKPHELPERKSPDFDQGRHAERLKEIEERGKQERERDFLLNVPPTKK